MGGVARIEGARTHSRLGRLGRRRGRGRELGGGLVQGVGGVARDDAVRDEVGRERLASLLVTEDLYGAAEEQPRAVHAEVACLRDIEVPDAHEVPAQDCGRHGLRHDHVRVLEAVGEHDPVPGGVVVRVVALDFLYSCGNADGDPFAGKVGGGGLVRGGRRGIGRRGGQRRGPVRSREGRGSENGGESSAVSSGGCLLR